MLTPEERSARIEKMRNFPAQLAALVEYLDDDELTARPLEGEWSVQQNVHHVADSHMNAYIRTKLILTEDKPPLKPYKQDAWAEMVDTATINVDESLLILRGLHRRWTRIFDNLEDADWSRQGVHPENGDMSLEDILVTYSDHGDAHIEQINRTLAAQG
jgi:hypothetical protein